MAEVFTRASSESPEEPFSENAIEPLGISFTGWFVCIYLNVSMVRSRSGVFLWGAFCV